MVSKELTPENVEAMKQRMTDFFSKNPAYQSATDGLSDEDLTEIARQLLGEVPKPR